MRRLLLIVALAACTCSFVSTGRAARLVASCSVDAPVVAGQPFTITATSTRYPFKLLIQEPQSSNTGYLLGPFSSSPVSAQWTTYTTGTGSVTVWVYGNSGHLDQAATCSFEIVAAAIAG